MNVHYSLVVCVLAGSLVAGGVDAQRTVPRHHVRTTAPHPHTPALRGDAPANDECANAEAIALHTTDECATMATNGDNTSAVASTGDPSCDASDTGYQDVWYSFNSGDNQIVTITLANSEAMTDWAFTVMEGCDGTEVACEITPLEAVDVTVTENTDYVIRVYSNLDYGVGGPFTLCVVGSGMPPPPPANDECTAPEEMTVVATADCGTFATSGDNTSAVLSAGDPSCDGSEGGYQDVWYELNSGDNTELTVTLTPSADMTDWAYVMLEGSCDGNEVDCEVAPLEPMLVTVTANTDYLIRVYSNSDWGVGGPFTLCVSGEAPTSGIADHARPLAFSVYPNPTEGDLTISWSDASGIVAMDLLDMAGRTVHAEQRFLQRGQQVTLALGDGLSGGVYTLRLSTAMGRSEQRVMVR